MSLVVTVGMLTLRGDIDIINVRLNFNTRRVTNS